MTTEAMNDTQALAAVLAETAASRAGDHPRLDDLADYLADALAPAAAARVQDHLVACRACAAKLLDLESLAEPGPETAEGVADLAVVAGWREQKSRIAALEAARRRQRTLRWVSAVAASFFVATVGLSAHLAGLSARVTGLSARVTQLRDTVADLQTPEVNTPFAYLDPFTARSDETAETVELRPEDRSMFLILTPPSGTGPWEVEVLSASGSPVWSGGGLVLSDEGTLRLRMPRTLLPAAEYEVRLYGLDGSRRELLQSKSLIVVEE